MLNATKKNMARTWFRRGALWREKQRDDYPDRDPDPGRDPDLYITKFTIGYYIYVLVDFKIIVIIFE